LKYAPTAESASLFAFELVNAAKRINNVDLDYSVRSLKDVDALLDEFYRTGGAAHETILALGCYLGQVFVTQAQGKWCEPKQGPFAGSWPMIELVSGNLCNPIGKVFNSVEKGAEDDLVYFYLVVTTRNREG
jgi:hypothetical protein